MSIFEWFWSMPETDKDLYRNLELTIQHNEATYDEELNTRVGFFVPKADAMCNRCNEYLLRFETYDKWMSLEWMTHTKGLALAHASRMGVCAVGLVTMSILESVPKIPNKNT